MPCWSNPVLPPLGGLPLRSGAIGAGTVIYAMANGPLSQLFMPMFEIRRTDGA